jgi:signal transduction histidine kinase
MNMSIIDILLFTNAAITLILALFVFGAKNRTKIHISLVLFMVVVALWAIAISEFRMAITMENALLWDRIIYIIGCLVPPFFLLFARIYITKKNPSRLIVATCTILPLIFIMLLLKTNLWIQSITFLPAEKTVSLGIIYVAWTLYYVAFMSVAFVGMLLNLKKTTGAEKYQLVYIIVSVIFPIIGGSIPNIFLPLFGNYHYIHIGPFSLTIMCAIMTYAMIKHRLLDIRFVISRTAGYILAVVFMAAMYVLVTYEVLSVITPGPLSTTRFVVSTILTLIIALSFQWVLRLFQKATTKIFYQEYYTIDQFFTSVSQVMATKLELNKLMSGVLEVIHKYLHATSSTIIVYDKEFDYVIESSSILSLHMSIVREDLDVLKAGNKLLVYEEMEDSKQKETMRKHDIGLFMPLATEHSTIGYILLGEKASGDVYFSQDIKALQIMAPELAIALENSQSYQKIKIFNETLKVEIAKATRELKNANTHLKQLDKLKDEFISIASHELRTPLTTLKGFLELELKDPKKLTYDSRNHLERAYMSSERMIALVNDMLDVSRIESGRMTFSLKACNMGAGVSEVVAEEEAHIKEKHAMVEVVGGANISVIVDCTRMHQVLLNLIDNALKFIPDGGHVTITCKDSEKVGSFSVTDNGPGIRKEDYPRLFTKFGKLGTSYSSMSETKGTGLGLYICKKLVELQHGKITMTSEVGKGSTFTVTVPKTLPEAKKSGTLNKEAHG